MSLAVIESILESTDMREVMRPFQDITYLLTVFFSVFFANVSIESVKSIIGRSIINLKQLLSLLQLETINKVLKLVDFLIMNFRWRKYQIQTWERSHVRPRNWWQWRVLVELQHSESWKSIDPRKNLSLHHRSLLSGWVLSSWSLPQFTPGWLP